MATLGTVGERINLKIRQGATLGPFVVTLSEPDGTPVDLTGAALRAQIRKTALDPVVTVALTVTLLDPLLGQFEFGLDAVTTTTLPAGEALTDDASRYVWDLEWEAPDGTVTPLFYGECAIFREVTRG
jgi:hypothetical protein